MRRALYPVLFGGFSLNAFMAAQSDGFYYDFTKTDRLFQENTGPTPVANTGDVIGLALDQRSWRGQTAASEKVPTGDWTAVSDAILSSQTDSGVRIQSGPTDNSAAAQKSATGFVVGRLYKLTLDVSVVAADSLTVRVGSSAISNLGDALNLTGVGAGNTTRYFIATATTQYFGAYVNRAAFSGDATLSGFSIKEIPGYAATQSNSGFRPTFQGGWARFDANDDRLGIGLLFGSKGFVMARRKLIQKTPATQIMFGAVGATGTDRLYFGVDTNGVPVGRIGNGAAMSGSGDITGVDGTIGAVWDGSSASLLVDGAQVATQTQTGAPTTTVSPTLGGYNNNGTPASFCNFDCRACVNGNSAPSAATLFNIHRALMAL